MQIRAAKSYIEYRKNVFLSNPGDTVGVYIRHIAKEGERNCFCAPMILLIFRIFYEDIKIRKQGYIT